MKSKSISIYLFNFIELKLLLLDEIIMTGFKLNGMNLLPMSLNVYVGSLYTFILWWCD